MDHPGGSTATRLGARGAAAPVLLRLLATSDVHAHLLAWDYHADRAEPGVGLARIATLVRRLRQGADLCLLVDNGDFLQGSPLGDAAALGIGLGPEGQHPVIAAMNALGYDAAALGNHEFSHGIGPMLKVLAQARFPVLSANIVTTLGTNPLQDQTLMPARALIRHEVGGRPLTIGVIGLTPPQTLDWEAAQIDRPLQARPILQAAEAHAAALRAEGADVVIALCHSGLALGETAHPSDSAAGLVAALPGIDAVVAGHSHRRFPDRDLAPVEGLEPGAGRLHCRPVVAPGFNGSHLGVIDLSLLPDGEGWRVAKGRARLAAVARRGAEGRLTPRIGEDAGLRAVIAPAHEATRAWAARVIGESPAPSSSHFALVLPAEPVRLIARAKAEAVRAALARGPFADLPVLATAAPFRAGGRGGPQNYTVLPQGPLTVRQLVDLYPFPNAPVALRLTGAEVAEWLERSAALYRRIAPGAVDAELIDPAFPAFNFDTIEGVSWTFDLTAPPRHDAQGRLADPSARRVLDLRLDGVPLAADRPVILATNTYRLSGAGGFARGLSDRVVHRGSGTSRDVVERYIARLGRLPPPEPPNWRLAPVPGATALFTSAPEAAPPKDAGIEALDLQPDGFRRFRLHFDQAMTGA